ncbi:MAG: TonB-dependent receptor [Hyphomonadaceae bacterium]
MTTRTFPGDNTSATVNLRGLVDTDNLISRDPAVGSYIDGVYIGRATGGNMSMLDVARVEVLRGPQGTLFGRNTIGGAINIVPNQPSDEFEGHFGLGYGNYNALNAEGVLNVPIDSQAAFRIALRHSEHDGYAESSLTGAELNADDSDYARIAFRLDANEDLEILLGGDWWHTENEGQWATAGVVLPTGALQREFDLGDDGLLNGSRTLVANPFDDTPASTVNGPGFEAEVWGVNGTINWDVGPGTLRSISAYRHMFRDNQGNDLDGTPAVGIQQFLGYMDQEQFSQEVQYFGEAMDGRLDYIFGAYYFTENGIDRSRSSFLPLNTDCLGPPTAGVCDGIPSVHQITEGSAENESRSIFAQVGFDLTERLKVNLGARYVEDTRDLTIFSRNVLSGSPLNTFNPSDIVSCVASALTGPTGPANRCAFEFPTAEFSYTPFTVGLDYRISDDVLTYAKYSRGFRAGGFNIRASVAAAIDAFAPEQADTVEIGLKSDWFNRMLRINAAIYQTEYQDIQLTAIVGSGGVPSTTIRNAGEGEITGLELESVLRLGDFALSLTYAHIDAEFTSIDPSVPPTVVTLGSAFIMTPENQASISGDYNMEIGTNTMRFHAGYDWRDDVAFAPVPPAVSGNVQEAYGLWNARVSFETANGLTLSFWGENLADEQYIITTTDLVSGGLGYLAYYPGDPMTYGVSLRYDF